MRNYQKIISLTLVFSFAVLLVPAGAILAIGQMSKPIIIDNVLRGQEVEETLSLNNSSDEDGEYGLVAEGDIADWAAFYLPDDLTTKIISLLVPAESKAKAIVVFSIPEDTPNGTYTGTVSVTSAPPKKEGGEGVSVSLIQKVGREVSITVTDQEVIDFEVSVIPEKYGVEIDEPLKIRFIYDNKGNIKITPQIQVKIKDINKTETLTNTVFPYLEEEPAVKPRARYEIPPIEVSTTGLKNGRYWAEISILEKGEVRFEKDFRFTVGKQGFILGAMLGGDWELLPVVVVIGTILGALILATLLFIAYQLYLGNKKRKKRNNKRNKLKTVL